MNHLQEKVLVPEWLAASLGAGLVLLGRLVHFDDHVGVVGVPESLALDDLHQQPAAGDHALRVPQATAQVLHVVLYGMDFDKVT